MEALTMLNITNTFSPALLQFHSSNSALSCRKKPRFLEISSCNSSWRALVAKNVAVRGLQATEISTDDGEFSRPLPSPKPLEGTGKVIPASLMEVKAESLQYEAGFVGGVSEKTRSVPDCEEVPVVISYLTSILSSRVYEVAIESPLHYAPKLSNKSGVNIWLKREDLQPLQCRFPLIILKY